LRGKKKKRKNTARGHGSGSNVEAGCDQARGGRGVQPIFLRNWKEKRGGRGRKGGGGYIVEVVSFFISPQFDSWPKGFLRALVLGGGEGKGGGGKDL